MRLIDADALERHVYTEWVNGELSNSEWVDFRQWLKDEPTVEAASPWHRVEEELPDDTRDVLAVRRYGNDLEKQEVIVAHLSVIMDMKRGFDKWWNATNITHWMPFPEPPKEDA